VNDEAETVPPFIPPGVIPPEEPLPFFHALWKLMDNPIETWPRAVYEEPYFLRGDDRQMFLYAADPSMLRDILQGRGLSEGLDVRSGDQAGSG
jgi:hypothetical protein